MKRIPRRIFTEKFKTEAIKLVTEQQLNIAEAGRQLKVERRIGKRSPSQVYCIIQTAVASIAVQRIGHCRPNMAC